ncbi:acyl-CoA dehydrogenase [Candidatus Azambacteria bacterium RIFCSPHIGHO2_02_FULL_52_12]|uniref:Acyl-coenzyme A dehydrogenase n=1 Tax=Candidatus Azambacteria bacterium RIFCSPLOWO2_01_FULL_46_25 TaxID=1797298 RepID=A0A1F5BUX9_9BACT|nr:MAG: acyl-CoA dehydrogenase [Candidatus Azambacteria bacterium RIFCSPHIGHO2_02_FULL_52_12]OGD34410.1 MAG: acyl-CoA dehydrogenase [Candidatus Azambacteria bacterium RIFCSPLOWO2_01_FULL_46_25]OGD37312.1 MAG: acyl-CoA dehydrogenase [Candidatus Azambacteria bacterium RIFCSPHIGHO2_01_FULL_51_74]
MFITTALILFTFAVYRVPIWLWAAFLFVTTALFWQEYGVLVWFPTVLFALFSTPPLRRLFLVRPAFRMLKKQKSHVSSMEKQALTAGTPGFEKGLFTGRPDWEALRKLPPLRLTEEELRFLNGPVEELCRMSDDWDIRYKKREIPDYLWDFAREQKLFGLRVPKERGGFSFSFQAQSLILGKIASRSIDVATMVELPTSLWPDEIVEKYGTEEQKKYYMPRFAESKEIISFAITGISNGSDATAMRDVGIVEHGVHEGKKVLGIRLNWKKRFITFAPKATLLVLGFQLFDPDNLLKREKDIGITLALIPANYPGIRIGRRHLPTNVAFPNGPIWGEDVFIPIEWIIGGVERAGQGWKMIMECLFVGRAIALPAISVAAAKVAARYSAAYARIRRQFGSPIGTFEGIEEPLAQLVETAYLTESARAVTTAMVDAGSRPLAVSSLMKYKTTEYARQAVNAAMDIHAGRGVVDGPSNYLMSAFLAAPIGVTVEGANIVTRSIITFAQGVLQTHPYLYEELESGEEADEKRGLKRFEAAFLGHISFFVSNVCRALLLNLTGGVFGRAPKSVPQKVARWYRMLWKGSCNFAYLSDVTTLLMGARLKKKQKLGGRLADALSELFLLSSVLKRYEDDGFPESDYPIVELCMQNGLYRFQQALSGAILNFPVSFLRPILYILTFPFGTRRSPAPDHLGHTVVRLVLEPGEVLDRLTRYIYISNDPDDITGRLEVAFKKAVETEAAQKKLDLAVRAGKVKRMYGVDWVGEAERQGILTKQEAIDVRELEELAERALSVDHFDPKEIPTG